MPISNSARGRENRRTLGREFPVFEESPPNPRQTPVYKYVGRDS
jgi:hypothetical protein